MAYQLIADIGGTNIRLGLVSEQQITEVRKYVVAEYAELADVISQFYRDIGITACDHACLAVASPIDGSDDISMTNNHWQFSIEQTRQQVGLQSLTLINDFTAVAMSITALSDDDKVQIGGKQVIDNKPIGICGAGTGLGVASLVPNAGNWIPIPGEGGHVDFAPNDQTEDYILQYLRQQLGHVSYEMLLSGMGLEQIYQALTHRDSGQAESLPAQQITSQALDDSCQLSRASLDVFCRVLGSFAGNLALTLGAHGGIYIAGGIVPRFIDYLSTSDFRVRFEDKRRLAGFVESIPCFVVTESEPGLLGANAYLQQMIKEK